MSNAQTAFGLLPAVFMERTDLTANEKYMVTVLSSFSNREGKCWPSVATLSTRSGMSERHVQRLCVRLIEVGLVALEPRPGRSNVLRLSWVTGVTASTPLAESTGGDQVVTSTAEGVTKLSPGGDQAVTQNYTKELYQEERITSDATERESVILETIRSVHLYPTIDTAKELTFIRTIVADFPGVDVLAEVKKWQAYKLDVPLERNSRPHSQLRTWMSKVGTITKPPAISADEYNERLFREDAL